MKKDEELRLSETVAIIPELVSANAQSIQRALSAWVDTQDRESLSRKLSLGGFSFTAADKRLRHMRRALLLAIARANQGQISPKEKSRVESLSESKVKEEFTRYFTDVTADVLTPLSANFHAYTWAGCPGGSVDERMAKCRSASDNVRPRLHKVMSRLITARNNKTEQARFVKWFGTMTDAKLAQVMSGFQRVANTQKQVMWYYHAQGAPVCIKNGTGNSKYPIQCSGGLVNVTWYENVKDAAYVTTGTLMNDANFLHVFCAKAFFGPPTGASRVADFGVPGQYSSVVAVLIHELTHSVWRSNDEPWDKGPSGKMYGSVACLEAAAKNDKKVLTNASNYQWYADEQ